MTVAVVTGGASGFGLAVAERCLALGFEVALLDRDADRVVAEAQRLADGATVRVLGMTVDVADAASVDEAAAAVEAAFGGVDLLISNVGVQLFGSVDTFTDDEWRWLLDVNVIGSARVARAFLPALRRAPDPHLAFTTSSSILDPASHLGAYQASKFAVWGLAETLRVELAADGVSVTTILPSGMLSRHLESSAAAQPATIERDVARAGDLEAVVESNPGMAAMLAMPEDAAEGVVEAVLAGAPYVITHGDLTAAVATRAEALAAAAADAAG